MHKYFNEEKEKIERKYSAQVGRLRDQKDQDIRNISSKYYTPNRDGLKIGLTIAIVIASIVYTFPRVNSGTGFLSMAAVISAIGISIMRALFKATATGRSADRDACIKAREDQYNLAVQELNAQEQAEKEQLANDINTRMNQYCHQYWQSRFTEFISEWLTHVLEGCVAKADRSKWLPQIKAEFSFTVEPKQVNVPGYGVYNMASQGIVIDDNPLARSALAYVLENAILQKAQTRLAVDQNGGKTVITSERDDATVKILYSAPNNML